MLEELLPDRARLRAVFEKAGLLCVESHVVMQTIAQTWGIR
jgi:hypothetical protein